MKTPAVKNIRMKTTLFSESIYASMKVMFLLAMMIPAAARAHEMIANSAPLMKKSLKLRQPEQLRMNAPLRVMHIPIISGAVKRSRRKGMLIRVTNTGVVFTRKETTAGLSIARIAEKKEKVLSISRRPIKISAFLLRGE